MSNFNEILLKDEKKIINIDAPRVIKCPFRCICAGSSGSGKTTSFLNSVVLPEGPNKVVIWASPSASLRQSKLTAAAEILNDRANKANIEAGFIPVECDNGNIPTERIELLVDACFADGIPCLLVFDDLVSVKSNSRRYISNCFMNMRHRNCSVASLSQRIFTDSSARDTRLNANLFLLCEFPNELEVYNLARQLISDKVVIKKFMNRYADATTKQYGYLLIDLQNVEPWRFRKSGLDELYL